MWLLIPILLFVIALNAETLTGTILIKRKLTKPSVTAAVSIYQRGTVVELGSAQDSPGAEMPADPLDFERSHVVIWVEGAGPAGSRHAEVSLKQSGRRFTPDLVVIPAGSTVSFPNMDPIFHNVFSLSKIKSFDLGNYVRGDSRLVTFPKPGVVYVNCHLHPNMAATVVVTPNQWLARSDPAGNFRIPDLPPGRYSVVAWHKAAGFFRKTIQVTPGSGASVTFLIPFAEAQD